MANDTTAANAAALHQQAQSKSEMNKVINDLNNSIDKNNQKTTLATNLNNKNTQSVNRNASALAKLYKANEKSNTSLNEMSSLYAKATDSIIDFATKGKQSSLVMAIETKKLVATQLTLAQAVKDTGQNLIGTTAKYKTLSDEYVKHKKITDDLNKKRKEGAVLTTKEIKDLVQSTQLRRQYRGQLKNTLTDIEKQSELLHTQNMEMIRGHTNTVNSIKDLKDADLASRHAQGAFKSLGASAEEGFSRWLDSKSYVEALKKALEYAGRAFTATAKTYNLNMELAREYNINAATGVTGFKDAAFQAEAQAFALVKTAARLGMELDKVKEIAATIAAQKLGVISNSSIAENAKNLIMLTEVTAEFSRVTGVDSTVAVDMLRQRTEDMGLSAQQATADLRQMTTVLAQMQGAVEGDAIGMKDMVKLIDQASQTSGGFIVDTRLMTQAMRAAANEAERLGASKKMAMKSAEAMGKVVAGTGAGGGGGSGLISQLAGMDLAKEIAEGDKDKIAEITKGMTEGQKTFVDTIRKKLKSGDIDQYQAACLIEENMQSTDAMVEKKFQKMTSILGQGPEKYKLIAAEYHISETAAMTMFDAQQRGFDNRKEVNDWIDTANQEEIKSIQDRIDKEKNMSALEKESLQIRQKSLAEKSALGIGAFIQDNLFGLQQVLKDVTGHEAQVGAIKAKFGISTRKAEALLEIEKSKGLSVSAKKAKETLLFQKYLDPANQSKEADKQLHEIKSQGKTSDDMLEYLKEEFNIGKDNKLALDKAAEIANGTNTGIGDSSKELENLAKLSSGQISDQEKHMTIADDGWKFITDWLKTHSDLAAHGLAGGPAGELAAGGGGLAVGIIAKKYKNEIFEFGKDLTSKAIDTVKGLKVGKAVDTAEHAAKGKKGTAALIVGGLALTTALLASGSAKAAEGEDKGKESAKKPPEKPPEDTHEEKPAEPTPPPPPPTEKPAEPEVAKSTTSQALATASKVGDAAHIGLGAANMGLGIASKLGVKGAAKLGAKTLGKSIPFVGTILGAISTASQISDMWDKHKAGKSVGVGDWTRLGVEAASMIPLIGTAAAIAGATADATGAYDAVNKLGEGPPRTPANKLDVSKNTADIAASLKTLEDHSMDRKNAEVQGKAPPAGGAYNTYAYSTARIPVGDTVDETRPRLGQGGTGRRSASETTAEVLPSSYNEAEDSVNVKWIGLASLSAMLKNKEATSSNRGG